MPHHVIDAQFQTVLRDEIENLTGFSEAGGEWLLDEEMLARLCGAKRLWAVQPRRRV
jgi:hypothetical protein